MALITAVFPNIKMPLLLLFATKLLLKKWQINITENENSRSYFVFCIFLTDKDLQIISNGFKL